ncbi:MAG: CHAT domain-containing protein [Candidatus Pacebacteria bacterium]|nr:CHAT domain-containing protein [Candidatus Paceibacterota bacterium]
MIVRKKMIFAPACFLTEGGGETRLACLWRRARRMSLALVMFLVLGSLLSACSSNKRLDLVTKDTDVRTKKKSIAIGTDAVGEVCRAESSDESPDSIGADHIYDIFCGKWTQPSGRLVVIDHAITDRGGLAGAIAIGDWRRNLNLKVQCTAPLATAILDKVPVIWMKCSRRAGGLPHIAFVSEVQDKTYYADGLPTSQTVLERLIGIQSGKIDPQNSAAMQNQSSASALLQRQFSGKMVGNSDRNQFDRLMKLGREASEQGDYRQATIYYRDALKLQESLVGPNNIDSAYPMMNLAITLSNGQRFAEANQIMDRAALLVRKVTDPNLQAMFKIYQAINAANQHQYKAASDFAKEANNMFVKLAEVNGEKKAANTALFQLEEAGAGGGGSQNKKLELNSGMVTSNVILAWMLRNSGDIEGAQKILDKIKDKAEASRARSPTGYANFAETSSLNLDDLGRTRESETMMRQAVQELSLHMENSLLQVRSYMTLGRILRSTGRRLKAMEYFRTAARISQEKGYSLSIESLSPYLSGLYEQIQQRPQDRQKLSVEMFEASQLASSGASAQFIADAAAQLAQGSSEGSAAIRALREKNSEVERIQTRLDRELAQSIENQDPVLITKLTNDLKTAESARSEAEVAVQSLAPNYNLLRFKTVRADDVLKILKPGEGFLLVRLGNVTSYGFYLANGEVFAYPIDLNFVKAQSAVENLREAVTVNRNSAGEAVINGYDVELSYETYQKLLAPIEDRFPTLKKLIVAQTGALLSLPFGMLVTKPTNRIDNFDYRNVRFLFQDVTLQYVTSTQSFVILRSATNLHRAERSFAGFGDFVQASRGFLQQSFNDPKCASDLDSMVALGPLPGTKDEVLNISKSMKARPGDILTGNNFTKENLLKLDLGSYRILHFATHALLPTDLKCRSTPTMLVSPPSSNVKLSDLYFDTDDILNLKLNADLVVLSACNTSSQGQVSSGESLSGLAQSFFVAGVRGLVVSHWLAADQSTMIIMSNFYKKIADKSADSSAALQDAQLDLFNRSGKDLPTLFSHPLFWAVFTPLGDGLTQDLPVLDKKSISSK